MAQRVEILDQRDPVVLPFIASVLIHAAVVLVLFWGWFWMNRSRQTLGDIHPAGGPAYAVSPVHSIPIPERQAPQNPVANDTQSLVPTLPTPQPLERKLDLDKNAFQIQEKKKKQAEHPQRQQKYTQPAPPNQVFSQSRQALSNPMYAPQSGGGEVGIGPNSPLGNRLGWYAELVRQRIAQNWRTNGLDVRSQNSPAIVSFYIMRDGTVRDPKIIQSSGNPNIDNTALRSVYDASPLPPLPPQIPESYISAQFTFNLR